MESQEISEMPTYTNKDDVNDGVLLPVCEVVSCQQLAGVTHSIKSLYTRSSSQSEVFCIVGEIKGIAPISITIAVVDYVHPCCHRMHYYTTQHCARQE